MRHNLLISLFFLLLSCNSVTEEKDSTSGSFVVEKQEAEAESNSREDKKSISEVLEREKPDSVKTDLILLIDDSTQYSDRFIESLKSSNGLKSLELKKGMMILNQKDSVTFPEIPKINERTVFTGKKDNLAIALTLKRLNYTSLEYRFEIVEFGKSSKTTTGIADLSGFFFLGSESDTDDLTGESYFSTSYSNSEDSCYTFIRIGKVENSNRVLVKVKKNCNGEIEDINLGNFPALRKK